MRPEDRDAAALWDMLNAASSIAVLVGSIEASAMERDTKLLLAVERLLTIVGEAASRVSPRVREAHPEIAWRAIIAMRNIIVRQYEEVRPALLWRAAAEDVPELIRMLAPLVEPSEDRGC